MTDTRARGEEVKALGSNYKRLAERLAALLVDILLGGADCQRKGVNDVTCTCLIHNGWQVQNLKARILVDLWMMK